MHDSGSGIMYFGLKELHFHPSRCRESTLTAAFCEMSFGYDLSHQTEPDTPLNLAQLCVYSALSVHHGYGLTLKWYHLDGDTAEAGFSSVVFLKFKDGGSWE